MLAVGNDGGSGVKSRLDSRAAMLSGYESSNGLMRKHITVNGRVSGDGSGVLASIAFVIALSLVVSFGLASMPVPSAKTAANPPVPYIVFGYTYDESGAILPSCALEVRHLVSANSSAFSSDEGGWYQFDISSLSDQYLMGDEVWLLGSNGEAIGVNKTTVTTSGGKWLNLTLSVHAPIRIDGEADFDASHGVSSGTGTAEDPYIIENREISGAGYGYCIYIGNTTSHFVVRGCHLYDTSDNLNAPWRTRSGLMLYNASNGDVLNNNASSNDGHGIHLQAYSNNTVLANNTCNFNDRGIFLFRSGWSLLADNNLSDNVYGVHLYTGSNNNTVVRNNCSSESDRGIYLHTSNGTYIGDNNCSSNSQYGTYLYTSHNCTVFNNTFNWNGKYGIYLSTKSNDITVVNNTCMHNQYGIYYLSTVARTLVTNNSVWWSTSYAVYVAAATSNNNTFWNNTFNYNNGAGDSYDPLHIQAHDVGASEMWSSADGFGNYWSDWTYPDANGDGIVDLPYVFTPNQDNFPRTMNAWAISYTMHLLPGWNFVSVPLADIYYYASTLGLPTGSVVCLWDSASQSYLKVYVVGMTPPSEDFRILSGYGYFVYVAAVQDLVLPGNHPDKYASYSIALDVPSPIGGWVSVGWISTDTTKHASDIASYVSGAQAKFICKYDPVSHSYLSYVVGLSPPTYDFQVLPGDAMWIWVTPGGTLTYTP